MKHKNKYKPIISLIVVFLLFYFSSLFSILFAFLCGLKISVVNDNYVINSSIEMYYLFRILGNLFVSIIFIIMYKKDLFKDFKDFFKSFGKYTDIIFKYYILGIILMATSNILISTFTPVKIAANQDSLNNIIFEAPIYAFIFTSILAPFYEEIVFRKSFRDAIKNKIAFVLTSGIVFGSLHVVSMISSWYDLLYIIPYSSLGICFALIYVKTENIFSTIFIHFLHNSVLTLLSIFAMGAVCLW